MYLYWIGALLFAVLVIAPFITIVRNGKRGLNMADLCEWHGTDEALNLDPEPGCQNCGCLLEWKHCDGCGKDFLDWSVKDWDDVISGPAATSDGDLVCIRCAKRHAADERAQEEYEGARDGDWREYYP